MKLIRGKMSLPVNWQHDEAVKMRCGVKTVLGNFQPGTNIREVIELRNMIATYIKVRKQLEAEKHKRDTVESGTQTTPKVTLYLNNVVAKGPENSKSIS